jgi:hypothetical protein
MDLTSIHRLGRQISAPIRNIAPRVADRREPVISSVTVPQLRDLPNMIHPPLHGVVKAPSAVSARTLTCRAPAVTRWWQAPHRACRHALAEALRLHGHGWHARRIHLERLAKCRNDDPNDCCLGQSKGRTLICRIEILHIKATE